MSEHRGLLILASIMTVMVMLLAVAAPAEPAAGAVEVLGTSTEGHIIKRVYAAGKWHTFVETPPCSKP